MLTLAPASPASVNLLTFPIDSDVSLWCLHELKQNQFFFFDQRDFSQGGINFEKRCWHMAGGERMFIWGQLEMATCPLQGFVIKKSYFLGARLEPTLPSACCSWTKGCPWLLWHSGFWQQQGESSLTPGTVSLERLCVRKHACLLI